MKDQLFYKNTEELYKKIATETGLDRKYEGHFLLGASLDITTQGVSGSKREVSGTSLNLATKAFEQQLKPNCLYETEIYSRIGHDFSTLQKKITAPWHKSSWIDYQRYLLHMKPVIRLRADIVFSNKHGSGKGIQPVYRRIYHASIHEYLILIKQNRKGNFQSWLEVETTSFSTSFPGFSLLSKEPGYEVASFCPLGKYQLKSNYEFYTTGSRLLKSTDLFQVVLTTCYRPGASCIELSSTF